MAIVSRGLYRIPYASGTTLRCSNDHLTHSPQTRIDLVAFRTDLVAFRYERIVAAAAGVIRYIEDRFSENRPGMTPCNNNYVWIEHPNGEWTKYSHMTQDSVTGEAGLLEGDRVSAGTFLGYEGDVGCASRPHLHFEVGVPANPADPIDDQGRIQGGNRNNRIPRICGIPDRTFVDGDNYTARPCVPQPSWLEPVLHMMN
jgi:hypothetical protein